MNSLFHAAIRLLEVTQVQSNRLVTDLELQNKF